MPPSPISTVAYPMAYGPWPVPCSLCPIALCLIALVVYLHRYSQVCTRTCPSQHQMVQARARTRRRHRQLVQRRVAAWANRSSCSCGTWVPKSSPYKDTKTYPSAPFLARRRHRLSQHSLNQASYMSAAMLKCKTITQHMIFAHPSLIVQHRRWASNEQKCRLPSHCEVYTTP